MRRRRGLRPAGSWASAGPARSGAARGTESVTGRTVRPSPAGVPAEQRRSASAAARRGRHFRSNLSCRARLYLIMVIVDNIKQSVYDGATMNRLRIIPLDDAVAFPGMPITVTADLGTDSRVL